MNKFVCFSLDSLWQNCSINNVPDYSQLPKGVKWNKIAKVYMNKRNKELLELTKLSLISGELQRDRAVYEY